MEINVTMTQALQPSQPASLTELLLSLDQATLMAKQLPATADPAHLNQIYSSLQAAHHQLSSFLSTTQFPALHLPPPPAAAENSLSSASGAANDGCTEPMQVGDENEAGAEENSKTSIDKVEERMRNIFIKNKRAKRRLSPSSAMVVEESRLDEDGFMGAGKGFDMLRALDLVYQFHG